MSLIKANAVQVGQSPTATQNFTLAVPPSPDGTIKLARGNSGATTQDVLSVDASGNINGLVKSTGSTTSRSLANRFADVVNVKDFGAVGDGVADDTAAFVAAINANGKLILIPKGIYYVPNPEGIYSIDNISTLWLSSGAKYTTTSGGAGTDFSGIFYGEIMPRDFGPIAVANNNLPNTAGEAAGIKIITGQFPTATPGLNDRVAGTFIADNINKTTAGGGIWGLNVLAAQSPINSDSSPATDSMTRAVEFEVAKVLGGANPDPWSGAAPFRANGIEVVGMDGSVYQPTAALTTWANDTTGSKWWQIGAAFSRITKWGLLFKKDPNGTVDTGNAFGGGVATGASIRDESDSTSVISISGSHVNAIDLSGATAIGAFVRGINSGVSNIGFFNFADYNNSIVIDSGSTAAQQSQIILNDRGVAKWTISKLTDGRLNIYNNDQAISILILNPFDKSVALSSGAKIFSNTGSPEGSVTAPIGSLYTNTSGGTSTTLYVKTSGTGNTGWTAK